jgi:hypothetical protein
VKTGVHEGETVPEERTYLVPTELTGEPDTVFDAEPPSQALEPRAIRSRPDDAEGDAVKVGKSERSQGEMDPLPGDETGDGEEEGCFVIRCRSRRMSS